MLYDQFYMYCIVLFVQKQIEKEEFENIRGELLRTSGLTDSEVGDAT